MNEIFDIGEPFNKSYEIGIRIRSNGGFNSKLPDGLLSHFTALKIILPVGDSGCEGYFEENTLMEIREEIWKKIGELCVRGIEEKKRVEMTVREFERLPTLIKAARYAEYGKLVTGMCEGKCLGPDDDRPHVHTIHDNQAVVIVVGDWIVEESDGEHYYPVKNDEFIKNYKVKGVIE